MLRSTASITALIMFFMIQVQAQTVWTLEDCLNRAEETNLTLQRSKLNLEQSRINLKESQYSRLPNLNGSSGINRFSGRNVDPTSNDFTTESIISNNLSLNTNVTLFNGGAINNRIKQNKILMDAAKANLHRSSNDLALEVVSAFLEVLFSIESLENAKNQYAVSQEQLAVTQKSVDAGIRPRNDLLDFEAQNAMDEQGLIIAENRVDLAWLYIKSILRIDDSEEMILQAPEIDPDDINVAANYSFESLFEHALHNQPEMKEAELYKSQADIAVKLAKSAYYPSVFAGGSLSSQYSDAAKSFSFTDVWVPLSFRINGMPTTVEVLQSQPGDFENISYGDQINQNFGYGVGLSVNIPIFNRLSTSSNVARAKIDRESRELDYQLTKDGLARDIKNALTSARAAEKTWAASKKMVKASSLAYNNTNRKFELGSATSLDVATAKSNYDQAVRDLSNSKYDFIVKVKILDYYLGRPLSL